MIAISMRMMRITYPGGQEELRDAIAHDWWRFFKAVLPETPVLPVPNSGARVLELLEGLPVTGLLLSGGDDWGRFPQRDATEKLLFRWAERKSLPVVGVCRGAQVINRIMGGATSSGFSEKHAGTRHMIYNISAEMPAQAAQVNSYHDNGLWKADLAPGLRVSAVADDGSVEGFCGQDGRITGIMWHPEREAVPGENDIGLLKRLAG